MRRNDSFAHCVDRASDVVILHLIIRLACILKRFSCCVFADLCWFSRKLHSVTKCLQNNLNLFNSIFIKSNNRMFCKTNNNTIKGSAVTRNWYNRIQKQQLQIDTSQRERSHDKLNRPIAKGAHPTV